MTPADFDFLRGLLKRRSGLVLSPDKQYLVESRLLPVARKAGFDRLSALIGALKVDKTEMLMTAVVEAMTTNESFFFRDKVPFAFGAPPPQAARSLTRWRWHSAKWMAASPGGGLR
jgi:chemotaxis protein methyltransferase CheR